MRAKLYSTASGWNSKHASVKTALGIPTADGHTTEYAEMKEVNNEDHADHGKYVFPVMTTGTWKCDQLFSSGVVDWDDDWIIPSEEI